jgi:hypothetical protein
MRPPKSSRAIPCACGGQAHYREWRSKTVLTAVGEVTVKRPYYLCPQCQRGQFPVDQELDIEKIEPSPGVRRMEALVGQESRNAWIGRHQKHWLDKGKIEKLIQALRAIETSDTELAKKIRTEAGYFETHADRLR